MHTRSLLAILLLISHSIWAQTPDPDPAAEVPQTLEQAAEQRARAAQMRDEAQRRYLAEEKICYKKFLVNDCLDKAKKAQTQSMIEARELDAPARDFQREAKRADVEAKEAQRAADLPIRAASQEEQAQKYRAEEAAKLAARESKIAAKAQQAAKGRLKAAAEQAKRQEKQAKRAQKDAERAAKKAKEAEKAANKAAKNAPGESVGNKPQEVF